MPNNRSRNRRRDVVRNDSKGDTATWPAAGGVFTRLKIPCPEFLADVPDPDWRWYCYCSTTVPITFRSLPKYVNDICYKMDSIKHRSRSSSDSDSEYDDELSLIKPDNKAVLIKGALLLAEAKVYWAGGHYYCPELELSVFSGSGDEIHELCDIASNRIPKPLVVYLDCIGVTYVGNQEVTPVLAGSVDAVGGERGCAAPALAPCQLAGLLARLHDGVRAGGPEDARAALRDLPLRWEPVEADGTLRLADDCFRLWVADAGPAAAAPRYTLRWNHEDHRLFRRIMDSVWYCKGGKEFFGSTHLHGKGSPAQIVQTPDWREDGPYKWFTMMAVDDESIGKGAVFGFSSCDPQRVHPSRFAGTIETSYQSGPARCTFGLHYDMKWENICTDIHFGTIVPVTFSSMPSLIKSSWNGVNGMDRPLSSDEEAVFIKHGLILAEAKVYFAQKESKKTILHPDQLVSYSWEQVSALKHMPKWLPRLLAINLECLGITSAEGQEVTPVLAGAGARGRGAPALAPCQLAGLLARLHDGVRAGGPEDARAALRDLPLRWEPEDADGTLRLADDCFRLWVADAGPAAAPRYTLRWNHEDSRLYETSMRSRVNGRDCLVYTDLTHGKGSPAQFVQCDTDSEPHEYYVMTGIDLASFRLGAAFRFGDHADRSSRFTGTLQTGYMRGHPRPSRDEIINKLRALQS